MKEMKCQGCESVGCESVAEYLYRNGNMFIPVCGMCLEEWLLDDALSSNDALEIGDIDAKDYDELKKRIRFQSTLKNKEVRK
jgi:hypothetical protein